MANGKTGIDQQSGSEVNKVRIGAQNTLFGDPRVKPEKPYTIVTFPGGDVEIARCTDGTYWVHVAVRRDEVTGQNASIIRARIDANSQRYCDEVNAIINTEIEGGDIGHIAFLVRPFGVEEER